MDNTLHLSFHGFRSSSFLASVQKRRSHFRTFKPWNYWTILISNFHSQKRFCKYSGEQNENNEEDSEKEKFRQSLIKKCGWKTLSIYQNLWISNKEQDQDAAMQAVKNWRLSSVQLVTYFYVVILKETVSQSFINIINSFFGLLEFLYRASPNVSYLIQGLYF